MQWRGILVAKAFIIYYFDCILQGSKFINVTAFRMVNIYLCLLLGNLHTNKTELHSVAPV